MAEIRMVVCSWVGWSVACGSPGPGTLAGFGADAAWKIAPLAANTQTTSRLLAVVLHDLPYAPPLH